MMTEEDKFVNDGEHDVDVVHDDDEEEDDEAMQMMTIMVLSTI